MYRNYGDANFFEHGILVDTDHSDTVIDMLRCLPYPDREDLYQFAHLSVDITDSWIDKPEVMAYVGMSEDNFDPIQYAIACTDYYSWENFGAADYGVFYDWRQMDKASIQKELKGYLIAFDYLVDLFAEEPEDDPAGLEDEEPEFDEIIVKLKVRPDCDEGNRFAERIRSLDGQSMDPWELYWFIKDLYTAEDLVAAISDAASELAPLLLTRDEVYALAETKIEKFNTALGNNASYCDAYNFQLQDFAEDLLKERR